MNSELSCVLCLPLLTHCNFMMRNIYFGLSLLISPLIMMGCGPDLPDGISARNGNPLFSAPDTVEVFVFGAVDMEDGVRYSRPSNVEQAWLEKHDYAYFATEFDSTATETLQEASDADVSEGDAMSIAGNRLYVKVR